jgi:hypothetical protein
MPNRTLGFQNFFILIERIFPNSSGGRTKGYLAARVGELAGPIFEGHRFRHGGQTVKEEVQALFAGWLRNAELLRPDGGDPFEKQPIPLENRAAESKSQRGSH